MGARLVRFAPLVASLILGLEVVYMKSMSGHSSWVAGMLSSVSVAAGVLLLVSLVLALLHKALYTRAPYALKLLVEMLSVFICFCALTLAVVLIYFAVVVPAQG